MAFEQSREVLFYNGQKCVVDGWFIKLDTINDLVNLSNEVGEFIVKGLYPVNGIAFNPAIGFPVIEIYNGYRE